MTTVTFLGNAVSISGDLPGVGSTAPAFSLTDGHLKDRTLANYRGKRKLLNIVPSLDTATCAASARAFNQAAGSLDNTVVLLVSCDLPFAQGRFCEAEGLNDVIPLSTMRSDFATDYGVKITDGALKGLTCRAVVIIDENDQVTYTQLVNEIADEPDYESALAALTSG